MPLSLAVLPQHRIVVFEGLYVLVDQGAWKAASERMDVRVLVEVDVQTARKRLAERHVKSGICSSLEEGEKRGPSLSVSSPRVAADEDGSGRKRLAERRVAALAHARADIPRLERPRPELFRRRALRPSCDCDAMH